MYGFQSEVTRQKEKPESVRPSSAPELLTDIRSESGSCSADRRASETRASGGAEVLNHKPQTPLDLLHVVKWKPLKSTFGDLRVLTSIKGLEGLQWVERILNPFKQYRLKWEMPGSPAENKAVFLSSRRADILQKPGSYLKATMNRRVFQNWIHTKHTINSISLSFHALFPFVRNSGPSGWQTHRLRLNYS